MTGEQFLEQLKQRIQDSGNFQREYQMLDLMSDATAIGLIKPSPAEDYKNYDADRETDIGAAREEAKSITEKGGDANAK